MEKRANAGMLLLFIAIILMALGFTTLYLSNTFKMSEESLTTARNVEAQSNILTVLEVAGSDGRNHNLSNFSVTFRTAPGSLPLKLDEISISVSAQNIPTTVYGYAGTNATTQTDANTTHYSANYIQQGARHRQGVIQQDEMITVYFTTEEGIAENTKITIRFIPKRATETVKMVLVPEIMNSKLVQLYPSI